MIRVHWFDWVDCVWRWAWRPASVVRAMRHLTSAMIPAVCVGGLIAAPPAPPAAAFGLPPVESAAAPPVGVAWAPPLLAPLPASGSWPSSPSAFAWAPGVPSVVAPPVVAPLAVVAPVDQPEGGGVGPGEICPPEGVVPVGRSVVPVPVPAPGSLGLFVAATVLLLWRRRAAAKSARSSGARSYRQA